MSTKRRKRRAVVDTSVLVAGIAGMKPSRYPPNIASAKLLQAWIDRRHFVWVYSDDVLDEYRRVLAARRVRRNLIGRIINTLRHKGEHVTVGSPLNLSPDPDDNHLRLRPIRPRRLVSYLEPF